MNNFKCVYSIKKQENDEKQCMLFHCNSDSLSSILTYFIKTEQHGDEFCFLEETPYLFLCMVSK